MNMADRLDIHLQLQREGFALDVQMCLPAKGISVLFGASGSGKTTVLRCVAGLEPAAIGEVRVGSELWQSHEAGVFLPTHRRTLGYVFQEASLFEHLNVQHNIAFGLRRGATSDAASVLRIAVELLGIDHLLQRRVDELSGGERQRVAIARALATNPRLLLLDEPLAALDQSRKNELIPWLERLRDELHIPMLYVTHAMDELTRLGNHLVVLENGRVKASGTLADTLSSLDVQVVQGDDFSVVIEGRVVDIDAQWHLAKVAFPGGAFWVRDTGAAVNAGVRLRILAKDVSIATEEPQHTSIQNHVEAVIVAAVDDVHPSQILVRMRFQQQHIVARITQRAWHTLSLAVGQRVWAQVKSAALIG